MAINTSSLIFVDADLEAYWQLAEGAASNGEVLILGSTEDGVEQISHALQQRPAVTEVHILAHGAPGTLRLGGVSLELYTLDRYAPQIEGWFKTPVTDRQLYLYGCNVAAGDAGAEFLARLQGLTGASIAASTHLVGHASLGGDWQLDTRLGTVATSSLLTNAVMATYPAVLAAPGNDDFANATTLTGTSTSLTGTNVEATYQLGEPIHDPTVGGLSIANQQSSTDSVWWKWTAPASGVVTINTFGSSIDTVLSAYTGTAVNSLTQVANNNDANGTAQSSITFTASAGTTYYFAVDGAGLAQGALKITVDTPATITPDQVFAISESAVAGDTLGTLKANESPLTWAITSGNPDNDGDGQAAFSLDSTTGVLKVNDAGDLDFENFPQLYALQVTANDGSFTSPGTVFVNVTDSADAPVFKSLTPNLTTINEGSKVSLSGVFNDPDQTDQQMVTIDWGDATTTTIDSDNLSLPDEDGNRSFSGILHTYRDNGAFNIKVTVEDLTGNTDQATTAVTVNNVAPTITQGDTATLTLNEDSSTTLLLNATDPSTKDVLTWSISKGATNGAASVSVSPTGNNQIITYTPTANFSGTDTFEVQIRDDDGGVDTIAVQVNVAAQPDAPSNLSLIKSAAVLNEGQSLNLTGSFADPDAGDSFTVRIQWGDGSTETVLSNSDLLSDGKGNYSFNVNHLYTDDTNGVPVGINVVVQDAAGAIASASTPITINNLTPTITPGPTASFSTKEDTPGTITLTATDPADTSFTWQIASLATNGTVSLSPNPTGGSQVITYTPGLNFNGIDSFKIAVDDGDGVLSIVEVLVGVDPVNDAPQTLSLTPSATKTNEGDSLTLTGTFQDVDITDKHTITVDWGDGSTDVVNAVNNSGGNFALPANLNHIYKDEGSYTAQVTVADAAGATVVGTTAIEVANVAPVITIGGNAASSIEPLNVAEDKSATQLIDVTDVGVLDILTWSLTNQPTNGTVEIVPTGVGNQQQVKYTPNTNFSGTDTFVVQVADGDGGIDTLEYNVTVQDANDPPQILINQFNITEGSTTPITADILYASDIETADDTKIVFTISNLASGDQFLVGGKAQTTFTRADILNGNVVFVDNGDETAPSFTLSVSDGTDSTSAPAQVTFTKVNDAPVFSPGNTALKVTEGGSVPVLNSNISATDEESAPLTLVYTVSNVIGGQFLRSGAAVTQFTLGDLNAGLVFFKHDSSETAPSYTVSVTDGVNTTTRNDVPVFTPLNDSPQFLNNQFSITEGTDLVVTTDVLDATDIETTDDTQLKFTITGLASGDLFKVNGATATTFTRADVLNGKVTFTDNGDETAPTFTIAVSDGAASVNTPAKVTFTKVNDAPVFTPGNTPFTVTEGGTTIVRSTNLSATDAESTAGTLVFTVANVVGGAFYRSGSVVTQFTQAEVSGNFISFKHDGGEAAPSYGVTVSDGDKSATRNDTPVFVAVNDVPVFLSNSLTVAEGGTVTLTTADLSATDIETLPNDLKFEITGIAGGTFLLNGVPQGGTVTFELEDVVLGLVSFQQDGTETKPAYTVKVTDTGSPAASATSAATVTFNRTNDNPTLVANTFSITEGGTLLLSQLNIDGKDEVGETARTALKYTVSDVVGGRFARTTAQGTAITSFTQTDIDSRNIVFVHDGSDTTPTYTLTVIDTEGGSSSSTTPTITLNRVNEAPVLKNNTLTLTEGGTVVLGQANLLTTDEESTPDKLTYTITGLTGGQFVVGGKSVTSFTQADVDTGLVSFVHDGKNAAPTYTVKVEDTVPQAPVTPATPQSATGAPTIQFTAVNDVPTLTANAFAIQEGKAVTLTATELQATDEETTNPASLVYTVDQVNNGAFKLVAGGTTVTSFTQADINASKVQFVHDGSEAAPSYTLTVKDGGITGDPTPKTATQTVVFDGKFTNLNDLPVILANNLAISEGGTVTLTTANLDASDLETQSNNLKISIDSIQGGTFLLEGVPLPGPVVQFTLADVVLQRISFQQDGTETQPTYKVTVDDGNSGITGPSTVTLTQFNRVNDNPNILLNTFNITEGGRIILTQANIDALDEVGETARTALKYSVSGVVGGQFEQGTTPGVAIASFTQADIDSGKVVFVHDGSDLTPTYSLTVTDSEGGTDTEIPTVTFTRVNQAPTLVNNQITITEGGTVVLTSANLLTADEESNASQLTYTVDLVTGGEFQINKVATTSFTQADINNGLVSFVQNGTDAVPQYTVTVTDTEPPPPVANPGTLSATSKGTVTFTPVNDAPILTANPFTIDEGKAVVLSSKELSAVDEETTDPTNLIYTVDKATSGTFQLVANGTTLTSFSQADINGGKVQFLHDGSEVAPTYTLTVKDNGTAGDPTPKTATQTVDLTGSFNNLNDLPQLLANSLTIGEGGSVTFTTDNLNADDLETDPVNLTLDIAGVVGGKFQLDGVDFPGAVSFKLADVVLGRISFVQDGTETPPAYTVAVTDASTTTTPVAATVTFNRVNDNPTILANQFAVSEGATVILSNTNITATDEAGETPAADLKYTVGDVQGGRFAFATNSATAITSFTQTDLDKNRVVFVHDGSDTTPIYTLTVADSEGGTDVDTTPTVTFTRVNQAPALVNNKLTVAEGGTVVLGQGDLLTNDEESSPSQLTYTITGLTGGEFQINKVATATFTQAEVNNGLVSFVHDGTNVAPQYTVTVTDTEPPPPVTNPGTLSATGKATITFNPVNDAPTLTATSFEIQEGAAVLVTKTALSAADEETTNPAQLVYTVDKVSNGQFQLVASGATVTTFTQDDVDNNRVQFKHDDSEFAPSYTLTVADSGTPGDTTPKTATQTVTFPLGAGGFVNLNNTPKFTTNQLDVTEGSKVVLTSANLSATDDDSINSQLTFRITSVTGGTFYLNGQAIDSTVKFAPSAITFGKLSFEDDGNEAAPTYTVEVSDPEGGTTTQAATVKLLPVNDNPELVTNSFLIDEDGLLELSNANLLATDAETTDPTKLTYTIENLTGGTFVLFSGGGPITSFTQAQVTNKEVVFLQDGTEVAPSFTIKVSDVEGGSTTAAANVTFKATNDPPVLGANNLSITEGATVVLTPSNLSATDPDTLPTNLVFTISGLAGGQGEFQVDKDGDGKFETTGATSFSLLEVTNGRVRFVDDGDETAPTYSVSVSDGTASTPAQAAKITFNTVNDLPVANDDSGTGFDTNQNTPFTTGNVLANDTDADPGDLLSITLVDGQAVTPGGAAVTLVSGALVSLNAGGTFTYNPNGKFNALPVGQSKTDSFVYTVSDGNGGTDTATVQIVVNGVNDNPVAQDDSGQGFSTNESTPLTTPSVLLNDADLDTGDTLSITEVDGLGITAGGTVTIASGAKVALNANGTFAYDPNGKFESLSAGKTAVETFAYTVSDANGGTDTANVSVVINGVNDGPVAVNDGGTGFLTNEDTVLKTGNVLANDTDIDVGDTLSIIQVNGSTITVGGPAVAIASGAKVSLNGDGTFNYDPNKAFESLINGATKTDTFTYAISDGKGGTSSATVSVDITGLNDAPIAVNDKGVVSERLSLDLNVLANDSDPDPGDKLSIGRIGASAIALGGQVTLASGSLVVLNNDSTLTYVPFGFTGLASGQTGTDSFTYSVIDTQGQESTATVTVQIAGYTPPDPNAVNGVFDYEQFTQYALLDSNTKIAYTPVVEGDVSLDQLFDESFYLSQYSDVSAALDAGLITSGYEQFVNGGWLEGRNPSALYNESYYLSQNPDVAQAVANGAFTSGFEHFILVGHKEGRDPSARFNQQAYLASNPDVAAAVAGGVFTSGFEHYVESGSAENRLPSLYLYNEAYYLQQNPDVAQAVANGAFQSGFEHYVLLGQKEPQRNPSAIFSEGNYLALNPDVAQAVAGGALSSGFEHYVNFGRFEGRPLFV